MISLDAPSSSNTCITVITRERSYFQKHKIPVKIPVSISAIQPESIPYGYYLRVWIGVAEIRMIQKIKIE